MQKPDLEWRDRGDGCINPKKKPFMLLAIILLALLLAPFAYWRSNE